MLGFGVLAVLAPELTIATFSLILRLRGPQSDELLLALGLAALLIATLGLAVSRGPLRRTESLAGLALAGVAVFAIGLGTEAGDLAGLLQISFLALTQCALLLAQEGGLDRLVALTGLAGVPPFGLFASLALILTGTAARLPWLLLPLGAGLAALAWSVLRQLPAERRLVLSPAWLPLALLLIAGFAMPEPLLAWFRLAAR
jgi:hydrogenase-4 component F